MGGGRKNHDVTDETQLFELNRRSFTTQQNGRPLSTYFNELVSIFQEIDTRLTAQKETVAQTLALNMTLSRLRVHIFLVGLDPEFNQAQSEVLRKDPLLDLDSRYAYIRKDQSQRKTMEEPKLESENVVHMASQNRNSKEKKSNRKGSTLQCTHCGEDGHSKSLCYEIIGYPDWWDFMKKLRKKITQATVACSSQLDELANSTVPMAAHTSTNTSMFTDNCDRNNWWIIDSGATDHMMNNLENMITFSQ